MHAGRPGGRFSSFSPLSHHLRTQCSQGTQAREVVGRHGQGKQLAHLLQSAHHYLADLSDRLSPAKALLDAFAPTLAYGVAAVPGRASVDGTAADTSGIARDMGRDLHLSASLDEAARVIPLVGANRHAPICSGTPTLRE